MNHQPFENWLLEGEALTPQQAEALQEHGQSCESCRRLAVSWPQVQRLLGEAGQVAPAAGFSTRWQARLAKQRARRQRRQAWSMLAFNAGIAGLLLLVLLWQVLQAVQSPQHIFYLWIFRLVGLFSTVDVTQDVILSLLRSLAGSVTPLWAIFSFGALSVFGVLWIVAFQQLTSPRRVRA